MPWVQRTCTNVETTDGTLTILPTTSHLTFAPTDHELALRVTCQSSHSKHPLKTCYDKKHMHIRLGDFEWVAEGFSISARCNTRTMTREKHLEDRTETRRRTFEPSVYSRWVTPVSKTAPQHFPTAAPPPRLSRCDFLPPHSLPGRASLPSLFLQAYLTSQREQMLSFCPLFCRGSILKHTEQRKQIQCQTRSDIKYRK